jgi:hypothetical protein
MHLISSLEFFLAIQKILEFRNSQISYTITFLIIDVKDSSGFKIRFENSARIILSIRSNSENAWPPFKKIRKWACGSSRF